MPWVEVEDDETGEVFEAWEDEETRALYDEDGEELEEIVDDGDLADEVDELRDCGVAISASEEARLIEEAAEDGLPVEEVYEGSKALWRGDRPTRADRRRQIELAMAMAHDAGEAPLGDDGRPERLIDLDDDPAPPRLEDEDA